MKPHLILASLLLPAALGVMAGPLVIRDFKASQPISFPLPVVADSASNLGNEFKPSLLLSSPDPALRAQLQNWTTMVPDSAGNLTLVKDDNKARLQSFSASIRSPRFAKGKLKLHSSSMADVLMNGKSVIKKTASDSIQKEKDASITLNPEIDYTIQINVLSLPDDKAAPTFRLEFIPDKEFENVPVECTTNSKKRFTLDNTFLGKRVTNTALSPNGKYLLITTTERLDKEHTIRETVLLNTATGDTISANVPSYAQWMPKGSTLYYTQKMNKRYDVFTLDVPSMKRNLFAKDLSTNSIHWAPDCSFFIYSDKVKGKEPDGPLKSMREPDDRIPGNRDKWYLRMYDPKNRISIPLTYGGPSSSLCAIAPDSKKVLFASSKRTPSKHPYRQTSLIEMDLATLKTDTLYVAPGSIDDAIYSPDGKKLFVTAGPNFFGNVGVNSGKHPIANDYDIQGYIFDIASKSVKGVTRDFDPTMNGGYTWNAKDGKIYFRAEEGFYTPLYVFDPSNGKFDKITTELPSVVRFSIGEDETEWIAYTAQTFTNTGAAYLLNLKTGETRLLSDPLKESIDGVEFGKVEPWTFKSKKGDIIDGIICYPPQFDSSKKYPLIVYYYGGTSPSAAGMSSPYSPQVLASRDYVVYNLNPSGTTGYGQEFSARHVNAWGDYTADEIIEGVKKFCKAHPFVNDKKIGCMGASYGGFMTQYLLTKTDIFAAAVSHAGISNVTSYWGEGYWGYSYNSVAAAKSYPWSNPKLFTEHGSLFNADKIHTPLLLLHGTVDTNVPIGESIQLFNALRILDRDVEFITVEGENHIIDDFEKRTLWQNSIMAWFAKWLQDDPRWWNELYGK
ncbi:MAG: prolyl oligopeptidase family serine peptidase [Muribaculaceae bacterium]|nr:prolyl oligopeptidase family serine peptidase [Muribaculaceae bacterium]